MKTIKTLLFATFFSIVHFSCSVDEVQEQLSPESSIETINDFLLVNTVFQDIGNSNGDYIISAKNNVEGKSSSKSSSGQPNITIEPFDLQTFPKTITIDFGDGVTGEDGVTRKGMVTIISTGWYNEINSEHTSTFSNYYHNDYLVEGTHYVKHVEPVNGNSRYMVEIDNGKITASNSSFITYEEESYRTWISGSDTPLYIWDDQYLLEGTQSGQSSNGDNYTISIEEALHFILLPRGIESGIMNIDLDLIKNIKLNFTNSTITILGVSYPFS